MTSWIEPNCAMRALAMLSMVVSMRATSLPAQSPVAVGTRVRVFFRASNASPVIGVVQRQDADALRMIVSARDTVFPFAQLQRIEISGGRSNHRWRGAAIGGAISSLAFVEMACAMSNGSCSPGQDIGGFLVYAAVGAVPGALVGGYVGARMTGEERWRAVWNCADARAPREDPTCAATAQTSRLRW